MEPSWHIDVQRHGHLTVGHVWVFTLGTQFFADANCTLIIPFYFWVFHMRCKNCKRHFTGHHKPDSIVLHESYHGDMEDITNLRASHVMNLMVTWGTSQTWQHRASWILSWWHGGHDKPESIALYESYYDTGDITNLRASRFMNPIMTRRTSQTWEHRALWILLWHGGHHKPESITLYESYYDMEDITNLRASRFMNPIMTWRTSQTWEHRALWILLWWHGGHHKLDSNALHASYYGDMEVNVMNYISPLPTVQEIIISFVFWRIFAYFT